MLHNFRQMLAAASIENGMRFQTLNDSGRLLLRRFSPAPATLDTCACSVALNCPDSGWSLGNFVCQYGRNCTTGTSVWRFPGLLAACNTGEGVFVSDLQCLFNQTCVNTMLSMLYVDMPDRLPLSSDTLAIKALNASLPSKYHQNDSVDTIGRTLMIEDWIIESDYEAYFKQCAASFCTYILNGRMGLAYIVTAIIGLVGGLSVSLRLIIPLALYIFHGLWCRFRQFLTRNHHDESRTMRGESFYLVRRCQR